MESLVVNVIVGFWLVLFGAMAVFPLLLSGKPARQATLEDDVVISIQPVAETPAAPRPLTSISIIAPRSNPDRREAA